MVQEASPLALFNDATFIDVNSTPFEDIEALPDFLEDKIKSSEEYAVRVRHQGNMAGLGSTKKAPQNEEDTGDFNPNDIPF